MSCVLFFFIAVSASQSSSHAVVRAELERRYEELARATERRDLAAYLAVRHETFHTVSPDGRIAGPMDMSEYSTQFFAGVLPPITARFTIRALSVSADGVIASAEVFQELSRFRAFAGQRQKLETTVVQRETWIKTKEGWKLKMVDNVRDQTRRIDGKE
jgi:hypothetical protein